MKAAPAAAAAPQQGHEPAWQAGPGLHGLTEAERYHFETLGCKNRRNLPLIHGHF